MAIEGDFLEWGYQALITVTWATDLQVHKLYLHPQTDMDATIHSVADADTSFLAYVRTQ